MSFDLHEAARGRWRGILMNYGLSQKELSGKHGPCPLCGEGHDRFRFDDKEGRGTWICSHCGAGTGVDLVMKLRGYDFRTALGEIKGLVGMVKDEPIKQGMSDERKRELRIDLWKSSQPVQKGDAVDKYMEARKLDQPEYPPSLRFCPNARYSQGVTFPAMIAAVQDTSGRAATLHRTFLGDAAKADVEKARMMMPGSIPDGSAVRLGEVTDKIGIAEGIETALAACELYTIPTWAALNAQLLMNWEPPQGVHEVAIFGDNDASYTGQNAAFHLARRLKRLGLEVSVHIPEDENTDWADVWEQRQ